MRNYEEEKPFKLKKKKKTVDLEHYKTIVLMKNFEEIRNKRLQKERKEREEQKKKNDSSQWHNIISKEQLFGYQFRRNPFQGKSILSKFDFKKHKMAIENANRNIEKNNMNNTLKAVTLHYSNIKSKLNINDEDELTLLKEKIEKEKQKNMKKIQKPSSKMKLVKNRNFNTEFQIRNYTQQSSKRRYSIIPPKHGKNFYMLKTMTNSYNTTYNTDQSNNIMKKRRPKTSNPETSVKDEPIYTANIKVFVDDYNKMKKKLFIDAKKYRKRRLLTNDVIDDLMDIRNEMQVLCFKIKYLGYRFPKVKKNKVGKPKIDVFIDKMVSECERIDYALYT